MGVDAMTLYRLARKLYQHRVPWLPRMLLGIISSLHDSSIPYEAEIGEGTQLGYGGVGVVIHRAARIGRHCLISQQVTISGRSGVDGAPVIGDYVRVGMGAKILGDIQIGDFAVIGSNAVVIDDVSSATVVAGAPARVRRKDLGPLLQ
jgi:serine O-acetyltransferase